MIKPARYVLPITILAAVLVFTGSWVSLSENRDKELAAQKQHLSQLTKTIASYNARSLEAVDILLTGLSSDLSTNFDWHHWSQQAGFDYLFSRQNQRLPQLRSLIIFDEHGNSLFSSAPNPGAPINVSDRPYFTSLAHGREIANSGPYVGRSSGRYTYTLARRLTALNRNFGGVIHAALEPEYFHHICWPIRMGNDFDAVLINREGTIVASCRPTDLSAQSPLLGSKFSEVLADGKLRHLQLQDTPITHAGWVAAKSPVEGFPDLQVVSLIPERSLLFRWNAQFWVTVALAFLTIVALLSGGWLISRKNRHLEIEKAKFEVMRKRLGAELAESAKRLEQQKTESERASTAKNRFLAAASHDLRQPLHALALFASDLHRQIRFNNTEQLYYLAHQIQSSAEALRELLDSLLDLSRLDVSGITPQLHNFPVKTLFDRLAITFERAALAKGLQLRFRTHDLLVYSDVALLERLLANLISNAIRYTEKGSILVSARRKREYVLIEVRDTGIGIPVEHQQAIFTEFYQVNNAARESHKGLGLGLSIVDRLASALGTQVELKSWVGKGTRFAIKVMGENPQEQTIAPSLESTSTFPAPVIGVLGNCSDLLEAIELTTGWGYTICYDLQAPPPPDIIISCASNALAALEQFPQTPILALCQGNQVLSPNIHKLNLPIRPARLRALLRRLEG